MKREFQDFSWIINIPITSFALKMKTLFKFALASNPMRIDVILYHFEGQRKIMCLVIKKSQNFNLILEFVALNYESLNYYKSTWKKERFCLSCLSATILNSQLITYWLITTNSSRSNFKNARIILSVRLSNCHIKTSESWEGLNNLHINIPWLDDIFCRL